MLKISRQREWDDSDEREERRGVRERTDRDEKGVGKA